MIPSIEEVEQKVRVGVVSPYDLEEIRQHHREVVALRWCRMFAGPAAGNARDRLAFLEHRIRILANTRYPDNEIKDSFWTRPRRRGVKKKRIRLGPNGSRASIIERGYEMREDRA